MVIGLNGQWIKWPLDDLTIGRSGHWVNWPMDQMAMTEMGLDEMGLDEVEMDEVAMALCNYGFFGAGRHLKGETASEKNRTTHFGFV